MAPSQRLGRLEDPGIDFPFYNAAPVAVSGAQWLFVMAALVVGFVILVAPIAWPGGPLGALIPAVFFPAMALAALAFVAPNHWTVIFGRVGWREVRLMFGFALLNLVVSMSVGVIVQAFVDVTSNAAAAQLTAMDAAGRILFFGKTLAQLLGEELVTLLPFLALMHLLSNRFGARRRAAVVGAWLVSSLIFGLIHLPTYDWNLVQCVVIIGTARLVLTLPWIMTKNIWVCTGAHIINDWLLFSLALVGAGLVATG